MGVVFAILGGILKWILLILLGLIGLLLVLLLILICTPLRYKLQGEKNKDRLEGQVRVSWLLHLISFRLDYRDKKLVWKLKLGPKILASSEPMPSKPKKQKEARPQKSSEPEETIPKSMAKPEPPAAAPIEMPQLEKETVPELKSQTEPLVKPSAELSQEVIEKKTWRQRITESCWKIRRFFEKLAHPFVSGYRGLQNLRTRWDTLRDKWEKYPQKQETARAVMDLVRGLLRPLLPRTFRARLLFGTNDPATTGQVLGYYYMLWPLMFPKADRRRQLTVEADFDEPVLEFEGWCRGHFSIGSFLIPALRALMDANIRRLIRYIRSHQ